jgi:beta-xylosidase
LHFSSCIKIIQKSVFARFFYFLEYRNPIFFVILLSIKKLIFIDQMKYKLLSIFFTAFIAALPATAQKPDGWTSDNGDGTFTNPLFFEDTPDPSMIRVGGDYYLACSSMHLMPGLPIMHSRDLVNWQLINYCFDRMNPGPEYSFQEGTPGRRDAYGNGIWAPSLVYNKRSNTYYVFANVNNHATQVYFTHDPYDHWFHYEMKKGFHDLSVFFDDDGRSYVCWGYRDVQLAQLNDSLTDILPGTQQTITHEGGEGSHMYKINGKYYIIWSVPGANTPMLAGVADKPYGPYRVEKICDRNHLGVYSIPGVRTSPKRGGKFTFWGDAPDQNGFVTMHQGGIVDTPDGQWWGYAMQDHSSMGRITNLSPVTWQNDIPYFGLPGNLCQTPKVWVKPDLPKQPATTLVERNDDFAAPTLGLAWEFNHLPIDSLWSLTEQRGCLRLHTAPAKDFWTARNSLTQRIVGLQSETSVDLAVGGLQDGDLAGMALLLWPYAWIGVERQTDGLCVKMYNQTAYPSMAAVDSVMLPADTRTVVFRTVTNADLGKAHFAYSTNDGRTFRDLGNDVHLHFDMTTFQSARHALFAFNRLGRRGGYADFDNFIMHQQHPRGRSQDIPYNKKVQFVACRTDASGKPLAVDGFDIWRVVKLPLGRLALQNSQGLYLSIDGTDKAAARLKKLPKPTDAETFQWMELEGGNIVLMSLATNRYLAFQADGQVTANSVTPSSNRLTDPTRFQVNCK